MTSIATICGAVPLALSGGAGSEARSAIGWVIIGGVSVSTLMTLLLVPSLFLLVGRFTAPRSTIAEKLERLRESFGGRRGEPGEPAVHGAHGHAAAEPPAPSAPAGRHQPAE